MKRLLSTLMVILVATITYSKGVSFKTDTTTGALTSLSIDGDNTGMNWILSPDGKQYPWITAKYGWGLGYMTINGKKKEWLKPARYSKDGRQVEYVVDGVAIVVTRKLSGGELKERYVFLNTRKEPVRISDCGIYTPWNDNYADARTCVTKRCDAHIWAGDNASYVCALRMGDNGKHNLSGMGNVGLALTRGSLTDYEVWQRGNDKGSSNFRGVMAMCLPDMTLAPGKSYTLEWKVFEHGGKSDFIKKLQKYGSVYVTSDKFVYQKGETVNLYVNGKCQKSFVADKLGEQRIDLDYGKGKSTHATILVVSSYDELIAKRVKFILDNQQMNDPEDPRYGAYMVYDNETHSIYKNDDGRKSSDTDEGMERVGMGIFLAEYYKLHPSDRLLGSLTRYASFIRHKLQTADYTTYSRAGQKNKNRGYNYAWVADFYFRMYEITGNRQYALDGYGTMKALYRQFGYGFYCIDYPVICGLKALDDAGLKAQHDSLLADFGRTADTYVKNGLNFPKFEVNFEQSIVAPAVQFLLEYYIVTKDNRYLDAAKQILPVAEDFCGFQPDYHLHEISIRHWDGYWFGKEKMYGDVFPHYWSCINANVYYYYALFVTGDTTYMSRAREVVRNNLSNFFEDGSATCAFVYPRRVNGEKAHRADAFANDQDWALAFYLRITQ